MGKVFQMQKRLQPKSKSSRLNDCTMSSWRSPYHGSVKLLDRPKPRMWQRQRWVCVQPVQLPADLDECKRWWISSPRTIKSATAYSSQWPVKYTSVSALPCPFEKLGLIRYWLSHHWDRLKWVQVLAWCVRCTALEMNKTPGRLNVNLDNYTVPGLVLDEQRNWCLSDATQPARAGL